MELKLKERLREIGVEASEGSQLAESPDAHEVAALAPPITPTRSVEFGPRELLCAGTIGRENQLWEWALLDSDRTA